MSQIVPLYEQDVEAAETLEDAVLRLVWRDGKVDDQEAAVVELARRNTAISDRSAHNCRIAVATIRAGEDSYRVRELRKQTRPDDGPKAA